MLGFYLHLYSGFQWRVYYILYLWLYWVLEYLPHGLQILKKMPNFSYPIHYYPRQKWLVSLIKKGRQKGLNKLAPTKPAAPVTKIGPLSVCIYEFISTMLLCLQCGDNTISVKTWLLAQKCLRTVPAEMMSNRIMVAKIG